MNDKRFIAYNEEEKSFSHNISEKRFNEILAENPHYFDESGLKPHQCKECGAQSTHFSEVRLPEHPEAIKTAKARMLSYLEIHIQKKVEDEFKLVRNEIEKKIREKYYKFKRDS
jgi:hypothetical protein